MDAILSLNNPEVLKLEISRNMSTGNLESIINILDNDTKYSIKLIRPSDIDILTELFEADSIWACESTDSQLEYGKYDFFIMNECTYDCAVDLIEVSIES
mgnify:CR=1 FL=1